MLGDVIKHDAVEAEQANDIADHALPRAVVITAILLWSTHEIDRMAKLMKHCRNHTTHVFAVVDIDSDAHRVFFRDLCHSVDVAIRLLTIAHIDPNKRELLIQQRFETNASLQTLTLDLEPLAMRHDFSRVDSDNPFKYVPHAR